MRIKIIFFIILVLFSTNVYLAKEPDWLIKLRKIVPLQTTESEVEKLFGKPTESHSIIKNYQTLEGLLTVRYSSGKCIEKNFSVADYYDVEKGIITSASFRVDKKVKLKPLKINLTGFLREEADDARGAIGYSNFDLGIRYSTYVDLLTYVNLIPPKRLAYLECLKE